MKGNRVQFELDRDAAWALISFVSGHRLEFVPETAHVLNVSMRRSTEIFESTLEVLRKAKDELKGESYE